MTNKLVNRGIMALNNAGFQVVGFSRKPNSRVFKFKVTPDGPSQEELSKENAESHLPVEVISLMLSSSNSKKPENGKVSEQRNPGEIFDLVRYLGASDWRHAIKLVHDAIQAGNIGIFNVGDFIMVTFDVPNGSYKGVNFKKLKIQDTKVHIVDIINNEKTKGVVFNFDDILFKSAINETDKNEDSFSASGLCEYLNDKFLSAIDISNYLHPSNDEKKITLLSAFELFGKSEYWDEITSFGDKEKPHQFDYFKSERNKVKDFEKETHWYWTSSPSSISAARFCYVYTNGVASSIDASAVGGCAPAFCVA